MDRDFDEALARATERWMGRHGVGAVGQGEADGAPAIELWVTSLPPQVELPSTFDGYRVVVRSLGGEVTAQPT